MNNNNKQLLFNKAWFEVSSFELNFRSIVILIFSEILALTGAYYIIVFYYPFIHTKVFIIIFLGPRGPLRTPSSVSLSVGADAADALLLLIRCCCWCNIAADALLLLMHWCVGSADALMLLNQDQDLLADLSIAFCSSSQFVMVFYCFSSFLIVFH